MNRPVFAGVSEVANKILPAMRSPMRLDDAIATVSASIGIAWTGNGEIAGADLLKRADAALYCAKANGKNTYRFAGEVARQRTSAA